MAQITGVMNSTTLAIYLEGAILNLLTDASLTYVHEVRETTSKDSQGRASFLEGKRSWTMSGTAWYADDATKGSDELFALVETTRAQGTFLIGTGTSGNAEWSGEGYLTQWELSSPNAEENAAYTFSVQGTGILTKGTTV